MHGLYFICERKFYATTHVKITQPWKSTLCLETGKCFEERIRGGKEVRNMELFEFGVRMI